MTDGVQARVDVLIAVKAPAPWLHETLHSLRQQTYSDWRLVLVMDGFDAEIEQVRRQARIDSFEQLVVPEGSGLVTSLNSGLAACTAEFVARIDADDIALPGRFSTQVSFLDSNPDFVAVGSGYQAIDEQGRILSEKVASTRDPLRALRWYNPLTHPSMMLRRVAVVAAGGYNPQARHLEDYDLWLRLAASGRLGVLPEPLIQYRQHSNQVTKQFGYSPEARRTLLQSRLALARAEGTRPQFARLRHSAWSVLNRVKGR